MVRNVTRYISAGIHLSNTQIVPYIRIFCFDSGPANLFVKCEGKVGGCPSTAAVMERETRDDFLP